MYEVIVREPKTDEAKGVVVLLPGRGQPAMDLIARYDRYSPLECRLVAVQPIDEWYPAPKGAGNQLEAIWGLKVSVPQLDEFLSELEEELEVEREDVALVGFSAGAVMAIQVAAHSDRPFAAVVSHAGAILDPASLPPAPTKTPILLIHAEDDDCFEWEERYLPMREALEAQGYDLTTVENATGGHYIGSDEIAEATEFLTPRLP